MNKTISVIVPVYKVEPYLNKCIKSIVEQTYSNLEIILVNDGSPDKCPEICDKWRERDARIKVIHKKNGGLSDARNCGFSIATGDYISFIDSDDFIANNMFEKLLNLIIDQQADIAICNYINVDEEGKRGQVDYTITNSVYTKKELLKKLTEEKWWRYVPVWNKLYSRKSLENISFPINKLNEDQFVIHKIINNCNKIVCSGQILYFYLQRKDSIMSTKITVKRLNEIEAIIDRFFFFKENGYEEYCFGIKKTLRQTYNNLRPRVVFKKKKEEREYVKYIDNEYLNIMFEGEENSFFYQKIVLYILIYLRAIKNKLKIKTYYND